jgi:hypothetical protein
MGVELLIEPGRSTLMDSDTQEIGRAPLAPEPFRFLCSPLPARPLNGQVHLMPDYLSFRVGKARTLAASANPVTPEKEIDAVVQQVPEE